MRLADQQKDFPQWYLDVIEQADLAENAAVKGCIIFKPYGYALWEAMQRDLDARIKELGVQNAYFPLLIPESVMAKEAEHIEGFAPECAVVTHGGGKELTEKLYIRPTSETIIYATFAKWIQSHRDLPLKINQWANIVRWEMRTRPFLRTLEFLWQEGHTAHATKEDADAMAEAALKMYADFDRELLAIPVMTGRKPDHDKFAGALYTLTTEALAKDGKAIQVGTSHNLGQGFSEAYDVSFLDEKGESQRPWMTSWGVSTRLIGTVIIVHGDEKGLRLPPKLAPIQVVIVPIYKSDAEKKEVLKACGDLADSLEGIRVRLDDREMYEEKGFTGDDLDNIVEVITSTEDVWLDTMMVEEHGLTKEATQKPLLHGIITFCSFVSFGAIPLLPYLFRMAREDRFSIAIVSTFAALALLGIARSWVTRERLLRGAIEIITVGALGAVVAYGIGVGLRSIVGVVL